VRLHTTSHSLDPRTLEPGSDLVLRLDEAHGMDMPHGVLAHDLLTMEERQTVDEATTDSVHRWTELVRRHLTADGVELAWIWERDLITDVFLPTITEALALQRALERHSPRELVVADGAADTAALARAIASPLGIEVKTADARAVDADEGEARPLPGHVRLRRALVARLLSLGVPSRLRRGSVLMVAYWPLMPLLDRMLDEDGHLPAVWMARLPATPRRSVLAARRGGWIGTPGPRTRAAARRSAGRALDAARSEVPPVEPLGLPIAHVLHERALTLGAARAAGDLALARLFRRVLRRGRLRRVVVPYDIEPHMRLLASLAREAGVPTLLVAHGAYPLRHTIVDFQVSDVVALWSSTFGPTVWRYDRALHVVGYPIPHQVVDVKPVPPAGAVPKVLVLGHGKETQTSLFDDRFNMRHYATALDALRQALPAAEVSLRPHPSESIAAVSALATHDVGGVEVKVDRSGDIHAALAACDLCIGTPSTATFQAALAGTPVAVLNVSGYDWCWPLGGVTTVPLAHDAAELAQFVRSWAAGERLPGREDLLAAIGADGTDATDRLMRLVEAGPPGAARALPSAAQAAARGAQA
jgi:hypothetical protein